MIVYHEVDWDNLEAVLMEGLMGTSRGSKGADVAIIETDQLLDEHCPDRLKEFGLNRDNNAYAYFSEDGAIADIVSGALVPKQIFITRSKQAVLELNVDPRRCFVSDLDAYDTLKSAMQDHEDQYIIDQLANSYWKKILTLKDFNRGAIRRPEIMITYDIPPDSIKLVSQ